MWEGAHLEEHIDSDFLSGVLRTRVSAGTPERIGFGQVGMNLRVPLSSADPAVPASVVVKLASPDPTSRATGVAMRTYEREVKFYREVAGTVDIRSPRCHAADWDPVSGFFHLVLEDVAPAVQGDQIAGCDVSRAADAVDELVRLHAPRWGDDSLHDLDWMERRANSADGERLAGIVAATLPGFSLTLGDRVEAATQGKGMAFISAALAEVTAYVEAKGEPFCLTHGDYRLDNILFGGDAGPAPCVVVDWQTVGHGNGVADLAYFVGAGLLPDDRRRVEWELVERYAVGIESHGHRVDREWLARHYRREALSGVIMAVVASQIVGRTERGDDMFVAMASRHALQGMENGALETL